ncbi:MAG: hypothetical protein IJZ42_03795 [Lachnospiraceae bacterium]|nr:hypothetical protein [Lachnospiraceae bacterium]
MGINGVDSYYTQDFAIQNQEKGNGSLTTEFELKGNTATSQENAGNKKPLGLTTVGNQGYVATYADSSTAQDPVIKVGDCEIHVNDVNPHNATKMEMFALMSYMEDKGLIQNRGMKSFNKMTAYASQAEYNGYCNGIYDENAAWTTKRDWTGILENAKGSFMRNPQTYKQGLECENIIDNLGKWSVASYASGEETKTDDYWKIISDRKNEIYEKVKNGDTEETFQIGGSSFTQKEWDKLLSEVDDIMKEMREAMREEHQKRVEEDTEEENAKKAESVVNADVISKLFETESAEIQVSNFKEYETANYKFVPEPTIGDGGMRIVKNGQSVAVFSVDDLKIRVDEETGTRVLISELGGFDSAWYDAIPMDEELENGLAEAMGVENIPEVTLGGYYIGTHAGTGIQYVMRPGDEGRGGKVLLRNERDVAKYNALAEEYYNRYPNLINSQEEGRIWASFEIVGMAERTETGFVRIGFDNISYNDNSDFKKNWSVKLTGNTWELLNEWLKESRNGMKEWQEFSSWKDIFDEIGGSYERIWSDEELRQGNLNN